MVKEAHIVFFFVYVLWRAEYPVNSHDYVIMFYFDREEKFENSYVCLGFGLGLYLMITELGCFPCYP